MKFLNIRMLFCLLCLAMVTITGCDEQEMNDTNDCIVGVIISDDIYKNIYEGCYNNSLWIEVLNNESIGKDITIFTPAPTLHPNSPIEYRNVIEVLMPDQIYQGGPSGYFFKDLMRYPKSRVLYPVFFYLRSDLSFF